MQHLDGSGTPVLPRFLKVNSTHLQSIFLLQTKRRNNEHTRPKPNKTTK